MDITTMVNRYNELDLQERQIKAEKQRLNKEIKAAMLKTGLTTYTGDGFVITLVDSVRNEVDEANLVARLKEMGEYGALRTIEQPDFEIIEDLILQGRLSTKDVEPFIKHKTITSLRINRKG